MFLPASTEHLGRPHIYRSAGEDVHGMLLVGYPPA
jgi:hypothetical protein